MKSLLKQRDEVLNELYNEIFKSYRKEEIVEAIRKVLSDVTKIEIEDKTRIKDSLDRVMNKTETYNVLLTLFELDKKVKIDKELLNSMNDTSYNQHRTIAMNICDMYGSGASSFFGYIDCMFDKYFDNKTKKSFVAKGISALVASVAEVLITGDVTEDYSEKNLNLLKERGVTFNHLIEMVYDLQSPYNSSLTREVCEEHVIGVLSKQQTYHTIELCIKIDTGVERIEFGEQFQEIVGNDEGLYGIDESLNTSISKMYGMIAITNFGHLDKAKPGIIGKLDSDHEGNNCNTFIDDTVCALVAAACARLAHNNENTESKPKK